MKPTEPHSLAVALLIAVGAAGCDPAGDAQPDTPAAAARPPAAFVGNDACAACHAAQADAWTGSHHERSMQAPDDDTVLGDFDGTAFSAEGVTSAFSRRGDDFVVNTTAPDGRPADYRVGYAFGIEPLQQYLLEMPDGRLQAFDVAWDTRAAEQGGQRWFHLRPDERIGADDPLHWTGWLQNWNGNCAECHSTGVDKNYDPEQHAYATTFSSVNVGCESCHGPGSNHAAAPADAALGLAPVARAWTFAEGAAIAHRVPEPASDAEIEACAQCHSRRSQLTDDYEPGDPFLDGFRPAFLTDPLYYADGQIRDEVFVYGSFVQSRMHAAGVTCSDCHDPHSTRLRAQGNGLCAQCHLPSAFDTPEHHRHAPGTRSSECVSCHMRDEIYMVVDPRRDHSFRVPRPDLSVALGTPNACGDCHDQPAAWAAEHVADWFPDGRSGTFHYAQALHAGRNWTADRSRLLAELAAAAEMPAIARATAVSLLAEQVDDTAVDSFRAALASGEPLVELTVLDALAAVPPALRIDLGQRFLTDAPLAQRLAAAQALVPARSQLSVRRRTDLDAALNELRATQRFNLDRPEGLASRASLELELGRVNAAEAALRLAIEREPAYPAGYANLADLYRQLGREADAERALRDGLQAVPENAALTHALGLALVRADRADEALPLLERARELAPDDPRFAYVHGVALNSLASPAAALESLHGTHERFPGHLPTLVALATMHRDAGDAEEARRYARRLLDLSPANAIGRALLDELE